MDLKHDSNSIEKQEKSSKIENISCFYLLEALISSNLKFQKKEFNDEGREAINRRLM